MTIYYPFIILTKKMVVEIQSGLGDAIYAYPVVKELSKRYDKIELVTDHKDIFGHIENIDVIPKNTKASQVKLFWYTNYPNAFDQLCKSGNVGGIEFKVDIPLKKIPYFNSTKRICIVKEPYIPEYVANINKSYESFAGSHTEMQKFIDDNKSKFYFISVGKNTKYKHRLDGIDLDLNDRISTIEFLSLCKEADTIISQIGHLVAIACAYRKKILVATSNLDNKNYFESRLNSSVIPDTCKLI